MLNPLSREGINKRTYYTAFARDPYDCKSTWLNGNKKCSLLIHTILKKKHNKYLPVNAHVLCDFYIIFSPFKLEEEE